MYRLVVLLCALFFVLAGPSLAAAVGVAKAGGTVAAPMSPGTPLESAPQPPPDAQPPFEMSGCLERRQDRLVLRDTISGAVEEVQGNRLQPEVGNTVQVTARVVPGVTPIEGAAEVIAIIRLRRISRGLRFRVPCGWRRRNREYRVVGTATASSQRAVVLRRSEDVSRAAVERWKRLSGEASPQALKCRRSGIHITAQAQ